MHNLDGVTRNDQTRALALSTLAFTVCFAVWTIFSIIGVKIKGELGLSETQFGLLVATPGSHRLGQSDFPWHPGKPAGPGHQASGSKWSLLKTPRSGGFRAGLLHFAG